MQIGTNLRKKKEKFANANPSFWSIAPNPDDQIYMNKQKQKKLLVRAAKQEKVSLF
ncbi:hypothetical protein CU026_2680 [Enterococcus faecium]|nr:hypothetical protein I131_05020 [Enterococcus faecium CRL1879]MBK4767991.1 hypothetical protein [Enterococcus faecium]MBK4815865.1 hypothetical protein [Enterococcus faecium]